jgi:phage gp29-like protein
VSTSVAHRALSPWPLVDRFPTVIGQQLSFSYLASTFRLATTGYRQQYVDLLNELLEQDPHLYSVVQKRILSTANGRVDVVPFDVPEEDKSNHDLALRCARMVQAELGRIPNMAQRLAELLWGLYYGLTSHEIFWTKDGDGWHVDRLGFVHSRRLSYPDYNSWDLYLWDQGQVLGWESPWGSSRTNNGIFGLRVADWAGKYIVYVPALRGDYPTRDGIGRQTSTFATAKRIGVRGSMEYLERFAKPMMDTSWTTREESPDGQTSVSPRNATKEDIEIATRLAALGPGSGSYAAHPDSVKLEPKSADGSASAKITYGEFVTLCNAEESKAALGGTLGTEVGSTGGNRSLGEVQERGEADLEQYDAKILGEVLKRDLVTVLVRLNMPEALHVVPSVNIHVETDPDPKFLIECAKGLTEIGGEVDLDKLSEETGVALIPNETGKPRRSFRSDVADPFQVHPDLMSDEAKAQMQADKAAELELKKHAATAQAQAAATRGAGDAAPEKTSKTKPPKGKKAAKKASKGAAGGKAAQMTDAAGAFRGTKAWEQAVAQFRALCKDGKAPPKRNAAEVANEVFRQMAEDFPADAIEWIHDVPWTGPIEIDTDSVDFDNAKKWRAYKEPDRVGFFERKLIDGETVKPIILVKRPGMKKLMVVDGHHRALAYRRGEIEKALVYVARVPTVVGAWDTTHDSQRERTSG